MSFYCALLSSHLYDFHKLSHFADCPGAYQWLIHCRMSSIWVPHVESLPILWQLAVLMAQLVWNYQLCCVKGEMVSCLVNVWEKKKKRISEVKVFQGHRNSKGNVHKRKVPLLISKVIWLDWFIYKWHSSQSEFKWLLLCSENLGQNLTCMFKNTVGHSPQIYRIHMLKVMWFISH